MKRTHLILIAALLVLLVIGCTAKIDKATTLVNNPHPFAAPAFSTTTSENHHELWLKANNFNLRVCASCHGANLDGGTAGVSCAQCHTGNSGDPKVTDCNFCHGNRALTSTDFASWAPITDWRGGTSDTLPMVGRHGFHTSTYPGTVALPIRCNGCHIAPTPGHWDIPTHFNGQADMNPATGYDATTRTCTQCHGRSGHSWTQL